MKKEFKGLCKGVRLIPRAKDDDHICIQLLTEDDGNWFENDNYFSSYWIDDLINQLKAAKEFIETQKADIDENNHQWGWKFKE